MKERKEKSEQTKEELKKERKEDNVTKRSRDELISCEWTRQQEKSPRNCLSQYPLYGQ